ncbi:MAG TPA: hypothetical protein PLK37_09500 [Terricaulis sp.]|nr:hypothetical protein [Terricaulis sp.]
MAAPLIAAIVAIIVLGIISDHTVTWPTLRLGVLFGLFIGAFVGVPINATIGLAIHAQLKQSHRTTALWYAILGAPVGLLTAAGAIAGFGASNNFLPLGALCGVLSGFFFWLIRRPDRDTPPNPPTSAP